MLAVVMDKPFNTFELLSPTPPISNSAANDFISLFIHPRNAGDVDVLDFDHPSNL